MTIDPKKLEEAAGKALGDVNSTVQEKGPGVADFMKKYGLFIIAGVVGVAFLVHYIVG